MGWHWNKLNSETIRWNSSYHTWTLRQWIRSLRGRSG